MKTLFPVQLSCGLLAMCSDIWSIDSMLCPDCGKYCSIAAIETREWHVKCHNCRFGRWAGMSQENARFIAHKHEASKPGHNLSIDFQVPDDVREKWRQVFGRKRYPARFVGIRRTNIEIGKERKIPPITTNSDTSDIPSF